MKTLLFTCLGIIALSAGTALGNNSWGLYAAYWDTDEGSDDVGFGGKLATELAPGVQLELRATYFEDLAKNEPNVDAELEVIPLEVGLALAIPMDSAEKIQLMVGGGVGYYLMDGSIKIPGVRTIDAKPDDDFGFYLVAGADFAIRDNMALFGELKYTAVTAENITLGGRDGLNLGDADLDGIGFNVGIKMTW